MWFQFAHYCQNPKPTSTQPNLTQVWVLHENDITPPPKSTQTHYWQYLSCFWPDFDQTLKVGSWDPFEQFPTVTLTFVKATFVHIRNISAVTDRIMTKL